VLQSNTALSRLQLAALFASTRIVAHPACPQTGRTQDLLGRADSLELAFNTKPLRTLCESEFQAKSDLGERVAEILKHRLADLRAATSTKDLIAGRPLELDGADRQLMAIDLCDNHRIVFCANHTRNPTNETDDLDWPRISRIKILRIERSHD
jgi:hypothetical protein